MLGPCHSITFLLLPFLATTLFYSVFLSLIAYYKSACHPQTLHLIDGHSVKAHADDPETSPILYGIVFEYNKTLAPPDIAPLGKNRTRGIAIRVSIRWHEQLTV